MSGLVELLGNHHGLGDGEAELAGGLLLEGGGGEWGRGGFLDGMDVDGSHLEGVTGGAGEQLLGLLGRAETRGEGAGDSLTVGETEACHHAEVFLRCEPLDFILALHDQPDGHRLDSSGREGGLDFLPQHRRQLETDDAVEDATRLLGVDQIEVDVAGVLDGVEYGVLCDFVENDAAGVAGFELQHLEQVPGDSLPLAVLIGSEPYGLRLLCALLQLRHECLLVVGNLIDRLEAVVDIDAEILLFQIADMSVARHHLEVRPEEFPDGLRFCG